MQLPHHSLVRPVMALAFLLSCVSASTCTLNFSYVRRIHWNSSLCHNLTPSGNSTARDQYCCRDVLAVFGIALARRLKETSLFMLPNLPTSISCLQLYQSQLTSLSLPRNIVSSCVDPVVAVITPNMCARIETIHDWVARLGEATALNTACRPDLTNPPACDACVNAGFWAQGRLLFIDGNKSHAPSCFHFLVLYAAGIVNQLGPESHGSMSCIFGLSLMDQAGARDERRGQYIKRIIIIAVVIGTTLIAVCLFFLCWWMAKHKEIITQGKRMLLINSLANQSRFRRVDGGGGKVNEMKLQELPLFSIHDLAVATDSFHLQNKLGEGGFGPVYKGILQNSQKIAVKRLSRASGQGLEEFLNEVLLISKLQHRNLVRILGCCVEKEEKLLVYEYMPSNSLDSYLFDPKNRALLDWRTRVKIIEGISRGLLYLHRDSRLKIIHRDLKASNILLDEELNPKISDFGMARIFGGNEDQANTDRVVGTYGYMPPEYAMAGKFSEKSDVFSFGVLLLEIITGRRSTGFCDYEESVTLLGFVWRLWNENSVLDLIDEVISDTCCHGEVLRCIHVGLLCVQEHAKERPNMSTVCSMLSSEIMDLPAPRQPAFIWWPVATETITTASDGRKKCSVNNLTVTIIEGR